MKSQEILDKINKIQQEWWEGDVPMNVALSEIRSLCGEYESTTPQNN